MSRHFVEKEQWNDPWLRGLRRDTKLIWFYIRDHVDAAGVWDANYEDAEDQIGFTREGVKIDWDTVLTELNTPYVSKLKNSSAPVFTVPQVRIIDGGKWWLPKYIIFQHGTRLVDSPDDNDRKGNFLKPVFKSLRKHRIYDAFTQYFPAVEIIRSIKNEATDSPFVKPSIEEVKALADQKYKDMGPIYAELFWHHYNTAAWLIEGKVPKCTWENLLAKWHTTWLTRQKKGNVRESVWEKQKRIELLKEEIEKHKRNTYRKEGGLADLIKPEALAEIRRCKGLIETLEAEIKAGPTGEIKKEPNENSRNPKNTEVRPEQRVKDTHLPN